MALIDKASLLMVPSTYEAGKLYNVLPSGNRAPDSTDQNSGYDQTRADFDFDRGSNTAATRIGSDGLIKKYRENELLQSNQFDTTWAKSNATLTSGQSGYDGSSDAWKIEASGTAQVSQSVSTSGVQTYSVYAKAGTENGLFLRANGGNNPRCFFNLDSGTIGSEAGGLVDLKMADVGDGWYRCSITYNDTTNEARIYVANNSNGFPSSGSIYIQNAQLESGLVATEVLTSGATTGKAGVLVDLPRINYDANGENGSLLLEPSRLNKVIYSEYLDNATNTINGLSISQNQAISPEGVNNAAKIIEDTTSTIHRFGYSFPADTMAVSWYAKAGERNKIAVFTPPADIGYDLTGEGSIINLGYGTTGASIKSVGNGWYRCVYTFTFGSSAGVYIGLVNDSNQISYLGDGSSGAYIYGWQVESGSYPSSYIPNNGESGGITRAADSCSVTGASDVIGQTEGTLFIEFTFDGHFDAFAELGIFASASNRYALYTYNSTNTIRAYVIASNSTVFETNVSDALVVGQRYKVAFAVKSGDIAVYINGESKYTNTGTFSFNDSLDEYKFSAYGGGTKWNQKTHQTTLFKERLENAELATLTTL